MLRYALARIHPVTQDVEYLRGCFYWSGWSQDLERAKQCELPRSLKACLTKNRERWTTKWDDQTQQHVLDIDWEFRLVEIESVMTCDVNKGVKL